MIRDARLRGLSSEHHQALVIARTLLTHEGAWTVDDGANLGRRFDAEMEPHFLIEDEVLVSALRLTVAAPTAERIADDHAFLRAQMALARAGDHAAALAFGTRLGVHIRFEEREFFPACQEHLASEVLDEVARRSPHDR